jgi:hypothetical protein
LIERFPDHAIAFRSVNDLQPPGFADLLKKENFKFAVSRLIYYTDTSSAKAFHSRMFKSDLHLLKKAPYKICTATTESSLSRIRQLYYKLNIEKYSAFSPQYNENFIQLLLDTSAFTVKTWEKNGSIDAALAYFSLDKTMTSPLFAYDTDLPIKLGLYRQISALLLLDAQEKGVWLNQSAGGGSFKTLRRAEPLFEYIAVYTRHLPWQRSLPWKLLIKVASPIARKFLLAYKP